MITSTVVTDAKSVLLGAAVVVAFGDRSSTIAYDKMKSRVKFTLII
jgi:hypothetical protein